MPGKVSLATGEYYAHPQNIFCRVIGEIFDNPSSLNYEQRCQQLLNNGIAVWDTLRTCTRSSSLDSDIIESSITINDLPSFLVQHPNIARIFFNGAKAEHYYSKYIQAKLGKEHSDTPTFRLPSTSPAYASMSKDTKLAKWRIIKR